MQSHQKEPTEKHERRKLGYSDDRSKLGLNIGLELGLNLAYNRRRAHSAPVCVTKGRNACQTERDRQGMAHNPLQIALRYVILCKQATEHPIRCREE
jgi:hypothetical protein